jgi:hypothetical protein
VQFGNDKKSLIVGMTGHGLVIRDPTEREAADIASRYSDVDRTKAALLGSPASGSPVRISAVPEGWQGDRPHQSQWL